MAVKYSITLKVFCSESNIPRLIFQCYITAALWNPQPIAEVIDFYLAIRKKNAAYINFTQSPGSTNANCRLRPAYGFHPDFRRR